MAFSLRRTRTLRLTRLVCALVLLFFPAPALAQGQDGSIRTVIGSQLNAFRADDWGRAYFYASPTIQRIFPSVASFRNMVTTGYPAVHRGRQAEFLERVETPLGPVQLVYLVGPDGRPVVAHYLMERQPDGSWRINGVSLSPAPDLSA